MRLTIASPIPVPGNCVASCNLRKMPNSFATILHVEARAIVLDEVDRLIAGGLRAYLDPRRVPGTLCILRRFPAGAARPTEPWTRPPAPEAAHRFRI